MKKLALFASGSGSNAENIIQYFQERPDVAVSLIVSNKADAFVHQRAQKLGVPSYTFNKASFAKGDEILALLQKNEIDWIILAGFLLKLSQPILDAYPSRIINIHPALLPKYGGKGMYGDHVHQAVIEAGEYESGITIHYVNEEYDRGDIIFQASCEVSKEDTVETLANKIHTLEYRYFPEIIDSLLKKNEQENQQFDK